MRTDTKLAIIVAVVFIILGAWYITAGTRTPSASTAQDKPDTPADTVPDAPAAAPRLVQKNRKEPPAPSGADRPQRRESIASAKPTQDQDAAAAAPRPEPAVSVPLPELPVGPAIAPSPLPRADGVGLADAPALPGKSGADELEPSDTASTPGITSSLPPADDSSQEPAPPAPSFTEHTIQRGDTFTSLAVKYLGHARHTNKIAEANPTLEPRRLMVGAVVKIPAPDERPAVTDATKPAAPPVATGSTAPPTTAAQATPVPADRSYQVKPGEGWYTLAERFLGSGTRWTELYELNKGRVPTNFNILPAGTLIELPPGTTQATQ